MSGNQKIVEWLFETKALEVCPENKPFWYASCNIGPVYINTHYLYGSKTKAEELLELINESLGDKSACSKTVFDKVISTYNEGGIFGELIDTMAEYVRNEIDLSTIDYISGGERRDWYFSLILADILNIPHVTLFKDGEAYLFKGGISKPISSVKSGSGFLHIADLITSASSYSKVWIPAVRKLGGVMSDSLVVVDRLQGGGENLAADDVKSHAMVKIDNSVFETAFSIGLINTEQFKMIANYFSDQKNSMRDFLIAHQEFLENALNSSDAKEASRAKECVEKNLYNL